MAENWLEMVVKQPFLSVANFGYQSLSNHIRLLKNLDGIIHQLYITYAALIIIGQAHFTYNERIIQHQLGSIQILRT